MNILLGVTGSISFYKACDIANLLTKKNHFVTTVLTKGAQKFITPLSFEALTHNTSYTDAFSTNCESKIIHIELATKSDLILVAPASASFIARIANGDCSDLLSSIILATKSKVMIAPAMNTNMYTHKATQANLAKLKDYGYKIIEPRKSTLACGVEGIGALAKVEDIIEAVENEAFSN